MWIAGIGGYLWVKLNHSDLVCRSHPHHPAEDDDKACSETVPHTMEQLFRMSIEDRGTFPRRLCGVHYLIAAFPVSPTIKRIASV